MDGNIIGLLQAQLNKERQNSAIYGFVSASLQNQAYDGFSSFFKKQSLQELDHAQMFIDFLTSKRTIPEFRNLQAVTGDMTLLGYAEMAYATERSTTDALEELYRQADEAEEFQVCAFLVPLLTEQIEEESWSYDLVDTLSKTDEGTWRVLDKEYK